MIPELGQIALALALCLALVQGILPIAGSVILQFEQPVRDAGGTVIPGFTRSVFAGRSGATTGRFGVYASVISRIDDNAGRAVVVRRAELAQESFAQFARFDDTTISSARFSPRVAPTTISQLYFFRR